jgi:hypothetical protein
MGRFMKYTVEMVSGGMIYVPSFIKIGSGVQKLLGEMHILIHRHTHRQQGNLVSLLLFFQNKESRLKHQKLLKMTTEHDPKPVPSTFHPYILFPQDSS